MHSIVIAGVLIASVIVAFLGFFVLLELFERYYGDERFK